MLYVYSSMHSAKESGDLKGIGSKRVSKVPPAIECAACVKLATKVEVLENENKELKSTIIVLENRVEALENDIKELKSTNINFMEQLNSLRENVKNLMEHVVPTNEIRLRVLLYQFRDYIGKLLRKKPANQNWTVYLGNVANDPAELLRLGVSKEAVLFLSTEFGTLSESAHIASEELVSQAIDAVRSEYKRACYREIFNKVND